MSNRLFQGVIHQMRGAIDRTIGIIDETGAVISCSELGRIGEIRSSAAAAVFMDAEVCVVTVAHIKLSAVKSTRSMPFSLTATMSSQKSMSTSARLLSTTSSCILTRNMTEITS